MKWSIVITIVLIGGVVFAEIDDSGLTGNLQDLNLNKLPGNLSVPGNLPVDLSKAPTMEEAEKLLEEKCKKLGHPEAFETARNGKDELQKCIMNLVNITELTEEMELAKPTGDLDVVFRKYCRKSPDLQNCVTNFTASLDPCLNDQEKESKHLVLNISDSIVKFICYKEGDRIALFIAEGGFECLSSNQDQIQQCVNTTVSKNIPKDEITIDNLPLFVFGEQQCSLQTCVVNALETCSEPTPANIIDSLFNFVRKMTPCSKTTTKTPEALTNQGGKTSNATTTGITYTVVLASVFFSLLATSVQKPRIDTIGITSDEDSLNDNASVISIVSDQKSIIEE
ncbi:hypothetical protein L9F63_000436, partial [Diploptera punctata]